MRGEGGRSGAGFWLAGFVLLSWGTTSGAVDSHGPQFVGGIGCCYHNNKLIVSQDSGVQASSYQYLITDAHE